MSLIIPMRDYADFTIEVTLEGRPYILRFHWNTRGAFWVMAIYDRDNVLLADGLKLVIGFPVNKGIINELLPPGEFICMDSNMATQFVEPGRYDFISGRNIFLGYVPKNAL
jgi:hypothetical protein